MKKFTLIASLILCVVMLFALCGCGGFMPQTQARKLYKTYGRPQVEITFKYSKGDNNYEVKAVYELFMDKTPVAVVNFINLVNSGAYENTIIDTYKDSYNYLVMGRYKYEDEKYYDNGSLTSGFVGEFKSNNYREPNGGYSDFKMFSLAMYHDESNDDKYFNSANGTLIMATAANTEEKTRTLNSENYAVFAEMKSLSFYNNGNAINTDVTNVPSDVHKHFTEFSNSTKEVYSSKDSQTGRSVTLPSIVISLSAKMSDSNVDWSKLPKIG